MDLDDEELTSAPPPVTTEKHEDEFMVYKNVAKIEFKN